MFSLRPLDARKATRKATRTSAALTLAATIGLAASLGGGLAAPARAAVNPVMTYAGASVNNALVPAAVLTLTTVTPVKFDRGTYVVGGVDRGSIPSTVLGAGLYSGAGQLDLTGLTGSLLVTAKLYSGKYLVQSVSKWLRAVPLDTTTIPAGFPTATTTGVPAGTTLTPSTDLDVAEAGAVLDGLDVQGCLTVRAPNVTVRNSRITCDDDTLRAVALTGAPGFVMEDSEVLSHGSAEVAIGWGGYTLRRVEVHGTQDGPRLGNDVTIVDSYVHDLVRREGVHTDGVQSTSGTNVLVQHNTFDPRQKGSDDFLNSAVQLGSETGARILSNVVFQGNFFNGGAYSVNVSCAANLDRVVFRDNAYGHGSRYGAVIAPAGVTFSENRWSDLGTVVPVAPAC